MLSMVLQAIELCKELKLDFIEINMNLPQYQKNNIDINMMKNCILNDNIFFTIHLDENLIRERALKRGDKPELIEERLDSEREMFNTFYENHGYDECIDTNKSKEEIYAEIDSIFNKYGIKKDRN